MHRLALALVVSATLASTAYAKSSSKEAIRADYDVLCNVFERSGADKTKDPREKATKIASYLRKNIKTDEVKKFLSALTGMAADERGPALKKAAADAGYTGACPLADAT